MVIFMVNIPRRKIYEQMLIYEEGLIEMQILTFSDKNFKEFSDKYNNKTLKSMKESYLKIKALLILFIHNKKFENPEEFDREVKKLTLEESITEKLLEIKSLSPEFKDIVKMMDRDVLPLEKIESFEQVDKIYKKMIRFNDIIPKTLEIKRKQMKIN